MGLFHIPAGFTSQQRLDSHHHPGDHLFPDLREPGGVSAVL